MIKKIIFAVAITLSLTTHYAVCVEERDGESLDRSTILARLAKLDEKYGKEVKRNNELNSYHTPLPLGPGNSGGRDGHVHSQSSSIHLSNKLLSGMWVETQQLEALLKKAE